MINKRILSTLLALAILLSCVGWTPAQAQGTAPIDAETPADQTSISTLPIEEEEDELPEREPIARLYGEEGDDLNKIVYLNNDGTRTMYLYDYPVKYRDASGEIRDISLEIADGTTELNRFQSSANSIMTAFPSKASDGISLSGEGVSIKLIPNIPEEDANTIHMTGNAKRIDSKTISYDYDAKTTIEYSLTYTGFKEDIVVSEYTGQTEYEFLLQTNGLALTQIDGSFYLTDESGKIKAAIGDVIVFTADEKNNTMGTMVAETLKENHSYLLTVVLDAQYLADPNTAYPIRIDPTIDINYDANGSGAIEDVTIYSNVTPDGASTSLFVGLRETRGISRILMRFPNLDLSGLTGATVVSAEVTLRDLICEGTYLPVYCYPFTGANWTESTASWSMTQNWGPELDNQVISYSNGVNKNPKHRYTFNITAVVQGWINGTYSKAKGLIFKTSNEAETATTYEQRQFASYNRTNYRPTFTMSYVLPGSITAATNAVNEGGTLQLTAQMNGTITWASSDTTRATISSNGLVTAKKAGKVTVTATCDDYAPATFTLWVTVANGVYYIQNASSGYCLEGTVGQTHINTQDTAADTRIDQLWKITYLQEGQYVIRPMQNLSKALTVNNSNYVAVADAATTDSAVASAFRWSISYNTNGYAIQQNGSSSKTVTSVVSGMPDSAVYIGTWSNNTSCHWELEEIKGVFIRDTDTLELLSSSAARHTELGTDTSLAALGLRYEVYGGVTNLLLSSSNAKVATISGSSIVLNNGGAITISVIATIGTVSHSASFSLTVFLPLSGYELPYQPELWNSTYVTSEYTVSKYTNCYAYALNNQIDPFFDAFGCNSLYVPLSRKQQPGQLHNAGCYWFQQISLEGFTADPSILVNAVIKDFEMYNSKRGTNLVFIPIQADERCPAGTYKVALVISATDYHWYRQDSDGYWSHKQGTSDVKRIDESEALIINPQTANRGNYSTFVGYYAVSAWNNLYTNGISRSAIMQPSTTQDTTSTLNHEELKTVSIGMTLDEVIGIIGEPIDDVGSGTIIHRYCTENGGSIYITYLIDSSGTYCVYSITEG
jgi:hypothetical protein